MRHDPLTQYENCIAAAEYNNREYQRKLHYLEDTRREDWAKATGYKTPRRIGEDCRSEAWKAYAVPLCRWHRIPNCTLCEKEEGYGES